MFSPMIRTAIIVHGVITFFSIFWILSKKSSISPAIIPIIVFIPGFGILTALIAEIINRMKDKIGDVGEIETVKLEKDIYWKTIRKETQSENIVPLEEALIINDRQTRKKLVMEMLLDDPMKNIDILLLARENKDVDTAHYANTTIAKIQRDFQLQVQKFAAAHETDLDNLQVLDNYIDLLGKFIDSRLSEAYLLHRQRLIYASLLDEKINISGWSKDILQKKFENAIALDDLNNAIETNKIMHENFPDDEQTWINELQICVAGHDTSRMQKTIETIREKDINWSSAGEEIVSLWIEV